MNTTEALEQLERDYAAGEFSGGGYRYIEATPEALRVLLDAFAQTVEDSPS